MEPTENITPENIWAIVAWVAAALILLANAGEKVVLIVKAIKAPDVAQNDRLANLEIDMAFCKGCLDKDKKRLDALAEGDKVTKHAILALMGHGIDGNNVGELVKRKKEMEDYLIDHNSR